MGIVKLNFLKKQVEEFGKQSKYYGHENRRLEHKVKILNNQNDICECIIASYSISISFLKKFFVFQKICFEVKVLKTFKIFNDCHIKTCRSPKRRAILKIPRIIF